VFVSSLFGAILPVSSLVADVVVKLFLLRPSPDEKDDDADAPTNEAPVRVYVVPVV
jgi:hypothetical protein